jgi:Holliday junction DNA helicase RuvA
MFNSISGEITWKEGPALRLKTGGIEWDIAMPSIDVDALPSLGEEVRVWTWLLHREDVMTLFGFASEARRDTFLELLKVEGIGPKGAVRIMSGITGDDLEKAIENEDLPRLEAVPGLGKKTAQKLLLALKGKIVRRQMAGGGGGREVSPYTVIAAAVFVMGYDRKNINEALQKADGSLTGGGGGDRVADREAAVFRLALSFLTTGR